MRLSEASYRRFGQLYRAALREGGTPSQNRFNEDIRTELSEGRIKPYDFSMRALFEALVEGGREAVQTWSPQYGGHGGARLCEAGVDTGAFANIMGQITYTSILPVFESPRFLFNQIARTVPTPFEFERIPGVSNLGDVTEDIPEGHLYPTAGVGEEWIDTRPTVKHGVIVPVTKEAVFFDRTGRILEQANKVAQALAIDKEKRVLDVAFGIVNPYRRNGKAAADTYQTSDWNNLATTNGLTDWRNVETAQLKFDRILDPNTGEPVLIDLTNMAMVVPSALEKTAWRIARATMVRHGDAATTGAHVYTDSVNPLTLGEQGHQVNVWSNQYVRDRTGSNTTWFMGEWQAAVAYYENWPISTPPQPTSSDDEFKRDIVAQFKVTERGEAQMIEPRKLVKCTA